MRSDQRFKLLFIFGLIGLAIYMIYPLDEKINLGLDLRGGVDLVYGVDEAELMKLTLDSKIKDLKAQLEREKIIGVKVEKSENSALLILPPDLDEKLKKPAAELLSKVEMCTSTFIPEKNAYELRVDPKKIQAILRDSADKARQIIENRVNMYGVEEALVTTLGERQIRIQIPGIKDADKAVELIGQTAMLEFRLVRRPAMSMIDHVGEDEEVLSGLRDSDKPGGVPYYVVEKDVKLTGSMLSYAKMSFDHTTGRPLVLLDFTTEGAALFGKITAANVGKQLAIVLDDVVQSAPVIQEAILTGRAQITGRFTEDEANRLAIVLRAGALPAPIVKEGARVVGPTLGHDSIRRGVFASVTGAIIVVLFMLYWYKFCGLIADFALVLNVLFLLAALAMFKGTLTLPGIAGIALTIGMAVDANVLIFERIKEELRLGKTVKAAMEAGYARATWTIWDANITTLLTALALFWWGTGPVKGFALTLSIGIVASMFTAIFVTRLILDIIITGRQLTTLSI